jgi:hypothetical protein
LANPAKIRRASFSLFFFFFFFFFFFMNRFWGQFASGMKRELAVGDSSARFGRFTGAVWAIHRRGLGPMVGVNFFGTVWVVRSQSLSLARSVSLSHSLLLTHSLPLTLSLSLAKNFPQGCVSLPETSPKAAYLCCKLPPRPALDAQIRSERKKEKKFAGFRPDLAGIQRGIAGITVD